MPLQPVYWMLPQVLSMFYDLSCQVFMIQTILHETGQMIYLCDLPFLVRVIESWYNNLLSVRLIFSLETKSCSF